MAVVEIPPWWREATAPNRPRLPDPATARRHRPDPPRDAVTGRIRLVGAPLLEEALGLRGGVLKQHHLGAVLDAGHVQERLGAPLLVLVHELLVLGVQPRPRRQQLLQLTCRRASPAISIRKQLVGS